MAYDWISNKLYYTESTGHVNVIRNIDGEGTLTQERLLKLMNPRAIVFESCQR